MRFHDFEARLRRGNLQLFSLRDARNLFPEANLKTLKNNLRNWQNSGYLEKLRRDVYSYDSYDGSAKGAVVSDFCLANRLYAPSYVSLEAALSHYGVIPEVTANVTSVTPKPTRRFKNRHGLFVYRTIKTAAYRGYHTVEYEGERVLVADREKAMADFIYFRLRDGGDLDFDGERLDKTILCGMDNAKLLGYARLFNKKTQSNVEKCLRWAQC